MGKTYKLSMSPDTYRAIKKGLKRCIIFNGTEISTNPEWRDIAVGDTIILHERIGNDVDYNESQKLVITYKEKIENLLFATHIVLSFKIDRK